MLSKGVNWGNVQICAFFALRSRPSTAPQSDWDDFCFKLKLALWVTRKCVWIHVGHLVCKLAGLQAHNDYQDQKWVVLHGKTACVGLHPQRLDCFTPIFLQWYLFVTRPPYHQKSCDLEWCVAAVKMLWRKVGFTPRAIRRVPRNGQFSSAGVLSRVPLPLGAKLKNCPVRGLSSIHILKHPHLEPQLTPSSTLQRLHGIWLCEQNPHQYMQVAGPKTTHANIQQCTPITPQDMQILFAHIYTPLPDALMRLSLACYCRVLLRCVTMLSSLCMVLGNSSSLTTSQSPFILQHLIVSSALCHFWKRKLLGHGRWKLLGHGRGSCLGTAGHKLGIW